MPWDGMALSLYPPSYLPPALPRGLQVATWFNTIPDDFYYHSTVPRVFGLFLVAMLGLSLVFGSSSQGKVGAEEEIY